MKRVIYYGSLTLSLTFASYACGMFFRLINSPETEITFYTAMIAMGFLIIGALCGVIASQTYMSPREVQAWKEERAQRRSERLK